MTKRARKWKMWALVDDADTYITQVFWLQHEASIKKRECKDIRDAKWRVTRVLVTELRKGRK